MFTEVQKLIKLHGFLQLFAYIEKYKVCSSETTPFRISDFMNESTNKQ